MTRAKNEHYVDRVKFDIDIVLSLIGKDVRRCFDAELVSMESLRYQNFKHNGTKCEMCGLEGEYFMLEKVVHDKHSTRHFNLYGTDSNGKEIMLTKDHILPASLGGPEDVRNFRTLCSRCNGKRGNPLEFPLICACPI